MSGGPGDLDLHLLAEGRHERLWDILGARAIAPVPGTSSVHGVDFAVWAPSAQRISVVGDWNDWNPATDTMRRCGQSGVWTATASSAAVDHRYQFHVVGADGSVTFKSDPMARQVEIPPRQASIVAATDHTWSDEVWVDQRRRRVDADGNAEERLSIYELHIGSWRRKPEEGNRSLTYREAAPLIASHCLDLGFTHVELLPVAAHPFGGSWGYQVTGYYAPASQWGSPDDLRFLVDTLHAAGIGVIVDWVPAHFPRDEWALARFDGTPLYEHADPRRGDHPDWGTHIFDYGRPEVRNFLVANALYWIEEFHVDGLRVDAVASMLYLDYSRADGEWLPNHFGGRENLDAIAFLQELNTTVHRVHPGVLTIAEESTAWDGVSRPVHDGGLGFTHKWNMGWMHDTLTYFAEDPVNRRWHHDKLTFGLVYAFSEHFALPLSHDEVVHEKGSLLTKMPGDRWQQHANLRALYGWMWAHPGKQLLFMGSELAPEREWSHDTSLDWHLALTDPAAQDPAAQDPAPQDPAPQDPAAQDPAPLTPDAITGESQTNPHAGTLALIRELNRVQAAHPALWSRDADPGGFQWIDGGDSDQSVLSFLRVGTPDAEGTVDAVVCVANLTPIPRPDFRLGVPESGTWTVILNTDEARFAGAAIPVGNGSSGVLATDPIPAHGHAKSVALRLPPLAVIWLTPTM